MDAWCKLNLSTTPMQCCSAKGCAFDACRRRLCPGEYPARGDCRGCLVARTALGRGPSSWVQGLPRYPEYDLASLQPQAVCWQGLIWAVITCRGRRCCKRCPPRLPLQSATAGAPPRSTQPWCRHLRSSCAPTPTSACEAAMHMLAPGMPQLQHSRISGTCDVLNKRFLRFGFSCE